MAIAVFVRRSGVARGRLKCGSYAVLLRFRDPTQQERSVRSQAEPCHTRCCPAKTLSARAQTLRYSAETVDEKGDEAQKYAEVAARSRDIRVQPYSQETGARETSTGKRFENRQLRPTIRVF